MHCAFTFTLTSLELNMEIKLMKTSAKNQQKQRMHWCVYVSYNFAQYSAASNMYSLHFAGTAKPFLFIRLSQNLQPC